MVSAAQRKKKGLAARTERILTRLRGRDAETARLESIVFGTSGGADDDSKDDGDAEEEAPEETQEEAKSEDEEDAEGAEAASKARAGKRKRSAREGPQAPAWVDPDDAELRVDLSAPGRSRRLRRSAQEEVVQGDEYERRLREQFQKAHGTVAWAHREKEKDDASEDDDSEEEQIPTSSKHLVRGDALTPQWLSVRRLRPVTIQADADHSARGPSVIRALQFHPKSELLLTGGFDKRLRLYTIDGEENPLVSSFFLQDFPIYDAGFSPSGDSVLVLGRTDKMWCLDVQSGQASEVKHLTAQHFKCYRNLSMGPHPEDAAGLRSSGMYSVLSGVSALVCDVKTKQPIKTFQTGAACVCSAFSHHSDSLITADADSNIYEWDLRAGRCRQRVREPWATGISCMALSRVSKTRPTPTMAIGTHSGNVDLYDLGAGGGGTSGSGFLGGEATFGKLSREPARSIDNLTTRVSSLCYHHEGDMLFAATDQEKDSMKVVHMASGKVFPNWPSQKTPLGKVSAIGLSRAGGYLAIGNQRGRVLLYRLNHYGIGG